MKCWGNAAWLRLFSVLLFVCMAVALGNAAENAAYTSGTLLSAETCGQNCYRIVVRGGDLVYIAVQTTSMPWNAFAPVEFIENGPIDFRVDKNKLMLKRPNGKECKVTLLKRVRYSPEAETKGEIWSRGGQGTVPLADSSGGARDWHR
jgi:hypothetical protein